jgi:murein L,D-transpeptidase YcbB/YkuD
VRIIENGKTSLAMKVVVGKYNLQTPVFGEDLQYIVLNPQWNVPDSIARNEIIPKALRNPNYLKSHRMEIHRDFNLNSPKLSLSQVNAKDYVGGKGFVPFKFIEVPSKKNGLGRVKFLFPNHYSVYMHDTQSKYLFNRKVRMYSHGCIRLQKPNEMLKYIITHYTNTPWEKAIEMYDSLKTHYIHLTKRLPVHTAYFTIYIDDDGAIQEFKDIYDFDKLQHLKLNHL